MASVALQNKFMTNELVLLFSTHVQSKHPVLKYM